MLPVISALFAFVASLFQSRWAMQLKILALQPQFGPCGRRILQQLS